MPFRLNTAAATFSILMKSVSEGMSGVYKNIDDVLVVTESWGEHPATLKVAFEHINSAGLTTKPAKCKVAFNEVTFFTHRLGLGEIKPKAEHKAYLEYTTGA